MKSIIILVSLMLGIQPGVAIAAIISLANTGIGLTDNVIDPNYTIISGPVTGSAIVATSAQGFPFPPWTIENATSAWIAPTQDTNGPGGTYTYRTTFDLSGLNPASAVINGGWSTDNGGVDILINGTGLGFTTPVDSFNAPFDLFTINSEFIAGLNTLDFVVNNISGPTGLRVEMTGEAFAVVPVPASVWLLGTTLVGLVLLRRKNPA